jgi:hypothetical protein
MADFDRNRWPTSVGMPGRHHRNTQKKEPESSRTGPPRRRPPAAPLAGLAALYGCGPVRLSLFLDEPGLTTKMTRPYCRSPRGKRPVGAVPHGHGRTTTFIAGLRQSGVIAPLVFDGSMTGACVPGLPRTGIGAGPRTRRRGGNGQPRCAQGRRRPRGDHYGRGEPPLPAALQPRSQPDRAFLRQPQGAAAQKPPPEPKRHYGRPPGSFSTWFRSASVETISPTLVTSHLPQKCSREAAPIPRSTPDRSDSLRPGQR